MARPRSRSPRPPAVSCDICGRTLLRGEHADSSWPAARGATLRAVHAARVHEGWIREGARRRRACARARTTARSRSLLGAPAPAPRADAPGAARDDAAAGRARRRSSALGPGRAARAGAAAEPRSVARRADQRRLKIARALDLFNAQRPPADRRGRRPLARRADRRRAPSATEGSVVTIVVAWELCWYRFEVDLADEAAGVRAYRQGNELAELDAADQAPTPPPTRTGSCTSVALVAGRVRGADDLLRRPRGARRRALRQADGYYADDPT